MKKIVELKNQHGEEITFIVDSLKEFLKPENFWLDPAKEKIAGKIFDESFKIYLHQNIDTEKVWDEWSRLDLFIQNATETDMRRGLFQFAKEQGEVRVYEAQPFLEKIEERGLITLAKEKGLEITHKKYMYWDNILHIGGIPIAYEGINRFGDSNLVKMEEFPKNTTYENLFKCIENREPVRNATEIKVYKRSKELYIGNFHQKPTLEKNLKMKIKMAKEKQGLER